MKIVRKPGPESECQTPETRDPAILFVKDARVDFRSSLVFDRAVVVRLRGSAHLAVFNSLMIASSASMISALSTRPLRKLIRSWNCLVGGRKLKTNDFGRPALGFAVSLRTACRVAPP